jgi:thymidylate kinase
MWSFFVHGYAKFQGDFGSHRNLFSELFSRVTLQVPIVAHLTVVLQVPYQVWKKRALKRLIQPHPTLFDTNFYNELQNAYVHVVSILGEPHAIIVDGQLPTEEICIHIKRTIDEDLRHAQPDAQALLAIAAQSLTISPK